MDPTDLKLQATRMANMMYQMQQQGGGASSTTATPPPTQVPPTYVQQQQQWLYQQQQHYLQQQQQFYAATSLANGSNDMSPLTNQNAYYSFSPMHATHQTTNHGQENNHVIHQNSMSPATPTNPATPIMDDKEDQPPQKVLVLDSESSQHWHQENYNNTAI